MSVKARKWVAIQFGGPAPPPESFLFTMASMVVVVNSVVAGAMVALVFGLAIRAPAPVPVVAGIVVGLGLLALALYYQHLRLTGARA